LTTINRFWHREELPICDVLHQTDGPSVRVELDASTWAGFRILQAFDLDEFLSMHPDEITSLMETNRLTLPDGGALCSGEGSYGSEGFAARVDSNDDIRWLIYFEQSNPVTRLDFDRETNVACFSTSSHITLRLNIDSPTH